MTALLPLAWRLARAGGRVRMGSVAAGNTLGTTLLLLALAIPGAMYPAGVRISDDQRHLTLTVLVFLCLPIAVLLMAVGRLSSSTRDRRLASLRLLGLSPARTRIVAGAENGLLAGAGAAIGAGLFLAVTPVVNALLAKGPRWLARPLGLDAAQLLLGAAAVVALSVVVSLAPTRTVQAGAVSSRREGATPEPSPWRLAPVLVGIALLMTAWANNRNTWHLSYSNQAYVFLVGTALAGIGLPIALPVAIRGAANLLARYWPGVTGRLVARRLQAEPASAVRLVSGLAVATFLVTGSTGVLAAFENTPQYLSAQRVVTTGPQFAHLQGPDNKHVTAAQLTAVRGTTGVQHVVPQYDWNANGCPGNNPEDNWCGRVFIGTCAQLTLFWVVSNCRDDTISWIPAVFDRTHPAIIQLADTDQHAKLTVTPSRVPLHSVTAVNQVRFPYGSQYQLFVPTTTAHLRQVLGRPLSYVVISDGGYPARNNLQATADHQSLDLSLDDISDLTTVGGYRLLMWTMAAIVLAIGLLAVLITGIDRAIERRRAIATQVALGIPARVLRGGQLGQTLLPLTLGLAAALTLGVLTVAAYLHYAREASGPTMPNAPWATILTITIAALTGALLITVATLPGLASRLTPDLLRRE